MTAHALAGIAARADDFVLITGCSGGGKSTLLAELAARDDLLSAASLDLVRTGLVPDVAEARKKVEAAGAKYVMGAEASAPGAFYEIKYRDTLGNLFDITANGWAGAVNMSALTGRHVDRLPGRGRGEGAGHDHGDRAEERHPAPVRGGRGVRGPVGCRGRRRGERLRGVRGGRGAEGGGGPRAAPAAPTGAGAAAAPAPPKAPAASAPAKAPGAPAAPKAQAAAAPPAAASAPAPVSANGRAASSACSCTTTVPAT